MIRSKLRRAIHVYFPRWVVSFLIVSYWRARNAMGLSYERELEYLKNFIAEEDWVVDVGVNMGQYTSAFAKWVGRGGKVIGFEASSETFELTSKIVNQPQVQLYNLALGSENRVLTINRYADSAGVINSGISRISSEKDPLAVGTEKVRCVRLDELLLERNQPITCMKCDVEGFESKVVAGAKQVITCDQPILLVEIQDANSYEAVILLLSELEYSVYQLAANGRWQRLDRFEESWAVNFLFVPQSKVSKIT